MRICAPGPRLPLESPPARLRVLQLGMGWFAQQPGGLNRYYADLLAALPAAGIEPRGLVCAQAPLETDAVLPVAAPRESLIRRWLALRLAVARELADAEPAVVAAHFALYARPVLNLVDGLPLVVHFHGPWAEECQVEGSSRLATLARFHVESSVYRRATAIITLSQAFKNLLIRRYRLQAERIRVAGGGVDVHHFAVALSRQQARASLGWPADRPIALAVRRLARRMGLEDLVDAAGRLRRSVPDALVLIAGAGRLSEQLHERIRSLGLGQHVRLLGFLPDAQLPLAYRAADVTIVPSVALEGFGLTAAESLAAGTPPLVTPVGGLPEVVAPLAPCLVLESSGVRAVADGLADALRGRMPLPDAERCRQYAARHFAWDAVAARVAAVYRQAAGAGDHP